MQLMLEGSEELKKISDLKKKLIIEENKNRRINILYLAKLELEEYTYYKKTHNDTGCSLLFPFAPHVFSHEKTARALIRNQGRASLTHMEMLSSRKHNPSDSIANA